MNLKRLFYFSIYHISIKCTSIYVYMYMCVCDEDDGLMASEGASVEGESEGMNE